MKVIVTGATGMVGEGVMLQCVANPVVNEILLVSRKSYGALPAKVRELIVPDFMQVENAAGQLAGYDAVLLLRGSELGGQERGRVQANHL